MAYSIQTVNYKNRLLEWSKQVEACRNSNLTVAQWCQENGVAVSTYYSWQRKVFQTVLPEQETSFVEVPMDKAAHPVGTVAMTIRSENLSIDIYSGIDEGMFRTIIQVLKSC
jgi:hypothetical protein